MRRNEVLKMKEMYIVTRFDTVNKNLTLLARPTEKDAQEQVLDEIHRLKEKVNILEEKEDYQIGTRSFLGINEHNTYIRTEDAEYFWKIDCVVVY